MAAKKLSSRKKAGTAQASPFAAKPGKGQEIPSHSEKGTTSKRSARAQDEVAGYDQLAQRTLNLWREQLTSMMAGSNPLEGFSGKFGQDLGSIMQPAADLFTQGFDLWLMMLDHVKNTISNNAFAAAFSQDQAKNHDAEKATGSTRTSYETASGAPSRSEATSTLSGAGAHAVAELARRLGELEQRFNEFERRAGIAGVAASADGAGKSGARGRKKAVVVNLAEAKAARPARRKKV